MSQCQGTREQRRVCLQQQICHPVLMSSELHRCRSCSMERLAYVQTHLQVPWRGDSYPQNPTSRNAQGKTSSVLSQQRSQISVQRAALPPPFPCWGSPVPPSHGPSALRWGAVGQGCLDCRCWQSVVHGATGHAVEQEWVYFSSRSDLDSVLLLTPVSCVSLGETSLAQLGFDVLFHKMGIMSSLLQDSQSCIVVCEGQCGGQATAGLGLDF